MYARWALKMIVVLCSLGTPSFARTADPPFSPTNIFAPVSTPANTIFGLSVFVLAVTAAIFVIVFALLAYAVVRFRKRTDDDGREPPQVYGSNQVELAWTVMPVLIVLVLFLATAVWCAMTPPYKPRLTIRQMRTIGAESIMLVALIGAFTGMVLGLQGYNTLRRFGSEGALGTVVALVLVRELGPVLTGLMVAGRNSSGMASELGSMVVTEQIDAMRALGTDPIKKLVTPRVTATVFMLFFLSIISDLVGLAGGLMVAKLFLSLDARQYWANAWQVLVLQDVFMGLLKPTLFGFIIATVGCYYGMTARGGTQGVGRATTQAVVAASVFILVTDFFVTKLLITVLSFK